MRYAVREPIENLYFLLSALLIIILSTTAWFIFNKRKKWALGLIILFFIAYISFYFYFPTLKVKQHEKRYEVLVNYLADNYPDQQFHIEPKHYESGYQVGTFTIYDFKTPNIGVTLRVDCNDHVEQISSWTNDDYPSQQSLWQEVEFLYFKDYALEQEVATVINHDMFIDDELTVFALTINEKPAIAIFLYSQLSYELIELKLAENESFVSTQYDDYLFVFVNDRFQDEEITVPVLNGEAHTIFIDKRHNTLIVEPLVRN